MPYPGEGEGRDTGQWEGGLKSGPCSFKSQVLVPARGRGAVLTSHLLTKAFASRKGGRATSSFQKVTVRAGGARAVAQRGLSLLRSRQQSRSHRRQ